MLGVTYNIKTGRQLQTGDAIRRESGFEKITNTFWSFGVRYIETTGPYKVPCPVWLNSRYDVKK